MPASGVCGTAPSHAWCELVCLLRRVAGRLDSGSGAGGIQFVSRGPLRCRRARSRLHSGICPGPGAVLQDFTERSRQVSASLQLACCEQTCKGQGPATRRGLLRSRAGADARTADGLSRGMQGERCQTAAAPVSLPVGKPALAHGVHHARHVFTSVFLWRIFLRPL